MPKPSKKSEESADAMNPSAEAIRKAKDIFNQSLLRDEDTLATFMFKQQRVIREAELIERVSLALSEQEAEIERLKEEVADWRDGARKSADEECRKDQEHCTCVAGLRKLLREAEARVGELREALRRYGLHELTLCGNRTEKPSGNCQCGLNAALSSTPALSSLSARREAEREVVEAAREVYCCDDEKSYHDCGLVKLYAALAKLDAIEGKEGA